MTPIATSAGKSSLGMKFFRRTSSESIADLGRGLVDHHLDQVGGLGPPGAADRIGGELVRERPDDVGLDRGDLVTAAHHERGEGRDERREDRVVAAHVGDDLAVDGGDRTVVLDPHAHVVDLVASVVRRGHVVRARGRPLHRPAEPARAPGHERLLGVHLQLRAEAAADVGGDHADALLGDAELAGQERAHEERDLRGRGQRQGVAAPLGHHRAWLDRRSRRAVVDDAPLDDLVRLGEPGLEVAAAQRPLEGLVRPEVLVDDRSAVLERLLRVGDDRERVVLDHDLLGRVDHRVLVLAEDDRDRVADVADLAAGQRPVVGRAHLHAGRRPGHRQRGLEIVEILTGEHRDRRPRGPRPPRCRCS